MKGGVCSRKRPRAYEPYYASTKKCKLSDEVRERSSEVIDYSRPSALTHLMEEIGSGKYGSVTKDVETLIGRMGQVINSLCKLCPEGEDTLDRSSLGGDIVLADKRIIDLENGNSVSAIPQKETVVIIDSDEEDEAEQRPSSLPHDPLHDAFLQRQASELLVRDSTVRSPASVFIQVDNLIYGKKGPNVEANVANHKVKDKGVYLGVDDEIVNESNHGTVEDEGLADIWNEMTVALEFSKDVPDNQSSDELLKEEDEDCDHSFILKDDIGYVCRVCGIIQKGIEDIIEFQYPKAARSRTYRYESRSNKDDESNGVRPDWMKSLGHSLCGIEEISVHPRHMKKMKPHQVEGFDFLKRNLLDTNNAGGCILAHAPGSGKTFMIISFMQSFLARCPDGRPLVVLPKGILPTWKKEFQRWQVEDIPLLDFYSLKADSRAQQLAVLKQWKEHKSILFLGYKQFSSIVTDNGTSSATVYCQEILLKEPSILILDEGHTPRNEDTDVLHSLAKVQTPLKVVLSGTLYQNHVKEVFNILNLVRPKFLKLETSRAIVKRILSRVQISGVRKQLKGKGDGAFYDLVEYALQQDEDYKRKETVIRDLREMTSRVLHYYKGDFLDELPGLVDFTVMLNLTPKQQLEVEKLKKHENSKFRRSSLGCAVYVHPKLKLFSDSSAAGEKGSMFNEDKIDGLVEKLDVRDGVKAKFFLNMLALCEAAREKLLVFSQYLLPLKFLERLAIYHKGWSMNKEIFMINGDTPSEQREWSMEKYNNSPDARVFFGSIKACGEGISLVGASRVIILDVHLNPSVSRQAIGRAFRPGQEKKVYTYRLVAAESPEEGDHATCFKKELIAKRWFEWNECRGHHQFDMEAVDLKDSGDEFLECPRLAEDVKVLHRRFVDHTTVMTNGSEFCWFWYDAYANRVHAFGFDYDAGERS